MKHNDYNVKYKIDVTDLANLFNLYNDETLGSQVVSYNINRGFDIIGLDTMTSDMYTIYTVNHGDCWTSISYKKYNTTRLWWLICKMNKIYDPFKELKPGTKLKILSDTYTQTILDMIKEQV